MKARWYGRLAVVIGLLVPAWAEAFGAVPVQSPGGVLPANYQPWPREVQTGASTYRIYEPQGESWNGSDLKFRAAAAVTTDGATRYGTLHGHARTWVEVGTSLVKLENIRIDRVDFPTAKAAGEDYLPDLQRAASDTWTVRREQLDRSNAVEQRVVVRNDPPRIIVSYAPALLVLIDGQPVLRKLPDFGLERVINTPALLFRDPRTGQFYLHAYDGWLTARELTGPWQMAVGDLSALEQARNQIGAARQSEPVDSGEGRPSLQDGIPAVYVSTTPAELIVLAGEPQFEPITGTELLWVKNTAAPLLLDAADNQYYTVISGRWFRAPALSGPWSFAPPDKLPEEIALIPDGHALAPVRAAVPGTPQAREAVIANSVPQTATVRRTDARFEPTIDGEPQLRSIEGTSLRYVSNSPTPIIRVDANSWYAVDRGVWFTARSLEGPWEVATSVPPVIYTIPATSPLHYVTYVKVYGATPDTVYAGYTPGYLGTVVAPTGTVVYGTGAYVSPWIGSVWYGTPWSYGFGWSVGVGTYWPTWNYGWSPWWGPAWSGWWRPPHWWWGGWGPRPGWGWRPKPGWGWGHPPGWGGWHPPVYHPPVYHPPVARPPIVPPPIGRPPIAQPPIAQLPIARPPIAVPPGVPPVVRPSPGSPIGPGWGGVPAGPKGPGWSTGAGSSIRAGQVPQAVNVPGLPQAFSRSPWPGSAAPVAPPGSAVANPTLPPGGTVANPFPRGPGGQPFRGYGAPNTVQTTPIPQRLGPGGLPAPGNPLAPVPGALPRSPFVAPPAIPGRGGQIYRTLPPPNANLYPRVAPGGVAPPQAGFPGVGAVPRAPGGFPSPAGPAMAPRFGGSATPGLSAPIGGYRGGPAPGVGAPIGGFRGPGAGVPGGVSPGAGAMGRGMPGGVYHPAPGGPRGPGWGGHR